MSVNKKKKSAKKLTMNIDVMHTVNEEISEQSVKSSQMSNKFRATKLNLMPNGVSRLQK